ncbi:MAG TPA: efflux RND transporter periplasmic adaptor subunit [Acidobacteriota bacterium]|nr:efflux RND transporter periplasmic adaptor subunit [Acidobacteriota bacterium]
MRSARILLYCSVFLLVGTSCQEKAGPPPQRPVMPVSLALVATKDLPVQVKGIGNVEAYSTVTVRSQVGGELIRVHFTQGQEVHKGELLFEIDPRPFQADLSKAEANLSRDSAVLKQSEANLARDVAQSKNAATELDRYQQLFEKGVAAKEQYDSIRTNAEALQAAVKADQAAIENARESISADRAAIETARLNLSYCSIGSPIEGRTGSLLVNQGNVVKSNDTNLVVINQVHPIYVSFSLPEKELPAIKKYMTEGKVPVDAAVPNDAGTAPRGVLTFVDNTVDPTTGTIKLRGTFDNNDRRLWPGQFVNVSVTLTTQKDAVVVPTQAVQTGQAGTYVFVIGPDMTAETRFVKVGRTVGGDTVIAEGLKAGEKVVTDGQLGLVNGVKVQVKEAVEGKRESGS